MNFFPRQTNVELSRNIHLDCPQCGELRWTHFLFDVTWRDSFSDQRLAASAYRCCMCGGIITASRPNFALLSFNRDRRAEKWLRFAVPTHRIQKGQ